MQLHEPAVDDPLTNIWTPVRLSRTNQAVGTAVHEMVVRLLLAAVRPTWSQIEAAVDDYFASRRFEVPMASVRAKCQSALGVYFEMFAPPVSWVYDPNLPGVIGHLIDVGWRAPDGIVIDELKFAGAWDPMLDRGTRKQCRRYLKAARAVFGSDVVGVRLVTIGDPLASQLITKHKVTPLSATDLWFCADLYVDPADDSDDRESDQ